MVSKFSFYSDSSPHYPPKTDFEYASELVAYIQKQGDFGISAACYPESHLKSPNPISDIRHLKEKVDAGARHLISQLAGSIASIRNG